MLPIEGHVNFDVVDGPGASHPHTRAGRLPGPQVIVAHGDEPWGVNQEPLFQKPVEILQPRLPPDAAPQGLRHESLGDSAVAHALAARLLNHRQHALQAEVGLRNARGIVDDEIVHTELHFLLQPVKEVLAIPPDAGCAGGAGV